MASSLASVDGKPMPKGGSILIFARVLVCRSHRIHPDKFFLPIIEFVYFPTDNVKYLLLTEPLRWYPSSLRRPHIRRDVSASDRDTLS